MRAFFFVVQYFNWGIHLHINSKLFFKSARLQLDFCLFLDLPDFLRCQDNLFDQYINQIVNVKLLLDLNCCCGLLDYGDWFRGMGGVFVYQLQIIEAQEHILLDFCDVDHLWYLLFYLVFSPISFFHLSQLCIQLLNIKLDAMVVWLY